MCILFQTVKLLEAVRSTRTASLSLSSRCVLEYLCRNREVKGQVSPELAMKREVQRQEFTVQYLWIDLELGSRRKDKANEVITVDLE